MDAHLSDPTGTTADGGTAVGTGTAVGGVAAAGAHPAASGGRAALSARAAAGARSPVDRPEGGAGPRRLLRTLAEYLLHWTGLLACGLVFLGWCTVAAVLSPLLPRTMRRRVGRRGIQRGFAFYLRLLRIGGMLEADQAALDGLRDQGAMLLAPNHPSMIDVVLVIARLPDVGCIMKAELWDNIFLGAGARMAGYIRNDSARNMIRLAIADLRQGSQLLVFPEGTRTVRPPVNPFTRGYALIASKARVPIQSIFIETDSGYLGKGWPLFRKPTMPIRYRVRLGRRFEPSDDIDALVREMERYYADQLGAGGDRA